MKKLGELLLESNLLTKEQLEKALAIQATSNRRLGAILIKLDYIKEDTLVDFLAKQNNHFTTTDYIRVDEDVKTLIPRYLCRKFSCVPLGCKDVVLELAMLDPSDALAIDTIEEYTNKIIQPMLVSKSRLDEATLKIPYSYKDIFNKDNFKYSAFTSVFLVAMILLASGIFYGRLAHTLRYGTTTTRTDGSIIHQNRDIIVERHADGKCLLMGRGAYAEGSFAIEFKTKTELLDYLDKRSKQFSLEQVSYIRKILKK